MNTRIGCGEAEETQFIKIREHFEDYQSSLNSGDILRYPCFSTLCSRSYWIELFSISRSGLITSKSYKVICRLEFKIVGYL